METAPRLLTPSTRELVTRAGTEALLSAASSWEIAIKYALGRLALPQVPAVYVPERMRRSSLTPLPVEHADALAVATLPMHHGDPFDRMLIAQAQARRIPIVTRDDVFDRYDVEVIPA